MVLYMCVTKDRYELPLIVEESIVVMARRLNVNPITINSELSKQKAGKLRSKYKRIEVEED